MKYTFTILFVSLSFFGFNQATWDVEVGGGGAGNPAPYYSPQDHTISVGDTVRWTRVQGSHNIDGRVSTFPSNPEGFFSGQPSSNWTEFDFVFTIPGVYDYECGQGDHSDTQFGTITVEVLPVGIEENTNLDFYIYPNPVHDKLNVLSEIPLIDIQILDATKNVSFNLESTSDKGIYAINTSELSAGIYFIIVRTEVNKGVKRFIKR